MSATIKQSVAALLLALLLIVFCAAPALALGTPKAVAYAPGKEPEAEQQKMTDEESALYYAKLYARYYSPFTAPAELASAKTVQEVVQIMSQVDNWTAYYTADEMSVFTKVEEKYIGIGVYLINDTEGKHVVSGTVPDSPAFKAGLIEGDRIVMINDVDTSAYSSTDISALLRAEEVNTMFFLTVQRDDYTFNTSIAAREVIIPGIDYYMLDGSTGYIDIDEFTSLTDAEVLRALRSLTNQGMEGLVIDLRDCGGGTLTSASNICGFLIDSFPLAFSQSASGSYNGIYQADPSLQLFDIPLALLVNGHTASAAEMFAAEVRNSGRGVLIGTGTFGKSYVQSVITLATGEGIKLTTGKYIMLSGEDITAMGGLTPDYYVTDAAAQLDKALAYLHAQNPVEELSFTMGEYAYQADGVRLKSGHAVFLRDGRSYVPLQEVLQNFGWQLEYRDGCWYGVDGNSRLILSGAEGVVLTGSRTMDAVYSNGRWYIPAAFMSNFGYTVTWDAAASAVKIAK
ncbi:MAG: PDZ domain-containing protein [Firmicutes bacterium]|nr:PDZ domain-containing protein [Bacillota bacterium]